MRSRRRSEQFEYELQAAQGASSDSHLPPMLQTAHLLSALAGPVPSPPHGLAPGRQRLLAEAARLEAARSQSTRRRRAATGRTWQFATAVVAALLLFGVVFGMGSASAASLPGSPLYGLKLAAEGIHVQLTRSPEAQANLAVSHAKERLLEITELIERGIAVNEATASRAEHQLEVAVTAASLADTQIAAAARERLQAAIQIHLQTMASGISRFPEIEQEPVRALIRTMERMRLELSPGAGEAAEPQERPQHGSPPQEAEIPVPAEGSGPGPMDTPGPGGSSHGTQPGSGPRASDVPYGPWEPSPPGLGSAPPAGEPGQTETPGEASPTKTLGCQAGSGCGVAGASPEPSPGPDPSPDPSPDPEPDPDPSPDPEPTPKGSGPQGPPGS